jgi:hypothetical protein
MIDRCTKIRNLKSAKINEKNKKKRNVVIQPPRKSESSDLHFEDVDGKLRDGSSEQVVLYMTAKCRRQREPEESSIDHSYKTARTNEE